MSNIIFSYIFIAITVFAITPFMVAAIVFVTSTFVGSHMRKGTLTKRENLPYVILVIIALAWSDMHEWWGPILQIGAAASGILLGHVAKS